MKSKNLDSSFLSKDHTQCLKGLFSLCILWHHISQKSMRFYATNLGTIFQAMGYLSVAMFFFISGYGLMKSAGGGTRYIDKFPRNRLLTFYADVVIITGIYTVASIILFGSVEWMLVVKTLTYGDTIISNGWYFQAALILYLLFYFSFKIGKNLRNHLLICTSFVFALCVMCLAEKEPQTIYESVLAFPLGMIIAFNERFKILYQNKLIVAASVVVFVASFVCEYLFRGSIIGIVCKMISALAFVIWFLAFAQILNDTKINKVFINPVLAWIGQRSLEVYAMQGLFLNIFKGVGVIYNSLPLYALTALALTMVTAALIHLPISRLNKKITR